MSTGNVTANTQALIKAQLFSNYILEIIRDGFLPDGLHRDVSDFSDGDRIEIPLMGETVIRDYSEDDAVVYDPIDTGRIFLEITEYKQLGASVSRKFQRDSYLAGQLESAIPVEHARLIKEAYETNLLAQANKQVLNAPNTINGFDHRYVASGANQTITLEDIAYLKTSFDKADVPDEGRILLIDPVLELSLNTQVGQQAFINNPMFEGMVTTGFAKGRKFVRNIHGFDIWVSNRLPRVANETITGGPGSGAIQVTGGVSNIAMCVADDQHKPFMGAWRQEPIVDAEYNKDRQRDEYVTTARWGFGLQRPQTLGVILTSATNWK